MVPDPKVINRKLVLALLVEFDKVKLERAGGFLFGGNGYP